jgi:hypothetical protein
MQLPANGEILHSSWDFLVRCHPRWISWVLRRRRRLTSSPSLIHPVEQNAAASTRWV